MDASNEILDSARAENLLLVRLGNSHPGFLSSLERVPLTKGDELERPGSPIDYVYFPESGLISVLATQRISGKQIEVGMIGHEGMSGFSVVLGAGVAASLLLVQSSGSALRASCADFKRTFELPELRLLWLRYVHVLTVQAHQTSLANGTATLRQRLARWLLMWTDRLQQETIEATHELIGTMLGVRRAGVTVALHHLEGEHLIRSTRNSIVVRDRKGLIEVAKGYYGTPEAEYRRLCSGSET